MNVMIWEQYRPTLHKIYNLIPTVVFHVNPRSELSISKQFLSLVLHWNFVTIMTLRKLVEYTL
jgi:hypothetical protein